MTETLVPLSSRAKLTALEQAGFKRSHLAQQLAVEYMTLYRWLAGKSEPHPRARQRIDELYRGHIELLPVVESLGENRPDALELLHQRTDVRERFLLQATFHSQALAGSRLTLAETRRALEGQPFPEALAATNLRNALLYLLEQAGPGFKITEAYVFDLHRLVMENIHDQARSAPRDPGQRLAPIRLQAWLAHCNLLGPHPVVRAARDHYEFYSLRHFRSGNGRVGRLLLHTQLLSCGLPPALIRIDDQHDYDLGLRQAAQGEFKPLERLVCESVLRGYQLLQGAGSHV